MQKCDVEWCNIEYGLEQLENGKCYCLRHRKQLKRYGKIRRTNRDPNEIFCYGDYAEMAIYDNTGNEYERRVLISLEDIEKVSKCKWAYNARAGASTEINGRYLSIHRYIMDATENDLIGWKDKDKFNCKRENLTQREKPNKKPKYKNEF